MKTDTQKMNELAISSDCLTVITEEEAKKLKTLLLVMYKDIASLCDKHNLVYMMGGGTCLGAIRHNGNIPWDDDLDLMMPRESYEKLIKLLSQGCLGSDYEYDTPNLKNDCKNTFLKIYRKDTLDIEITSESAPGPKGIFIDVFPMDYAPQNIWGRKIKGLISDLLQVISSCVLYTEYPSNRYKEFMMQSQEGKVRYRQRMFLGHLFGIIPHRKWIWWFDQLNAKSKKTAFLTIPTGRKHYMGETLPIEVFVPTKKGVFEWGEVNLPAVYHTY